MEVSQDAHLIRMSMLPLDACHLSFLIKKKLYWTNLLFGGMRTSYLIIYSL